MRRIIGMLAVESVATGLVEDGRLVGPLRMFPGQSDALDVFQGLPAESIGECLRDQVQQVAAGHAVEAVGVAFPGLVRDGLIEECPNIYQAKGWNLQEALSSALPGVPVRVFNSTDAMAAGIAATRGHLDRLIRAWSLGQGIGFGRYPWAEGVWEGGHSVVSLDPREKFCGCGGVGHLEGIMGHRAMRLRFLDMEPEEVFAAAKEGDVRCADFANLWHRALAAATATSIHLEGPGKFFILGPNARYVEIALLNLYLHEMVKMSPLQGSVFEVIAAGNEIGVIGAAVNAERAIFGG